MVCKRKLVSPKLAECSQSGMEWSENIIPRMERLTLAKVMVSRVCMGKLVSPKLAECSQSGTRWSHDMYITHWKTNDGQSDGIARVHGMNNVQAEELVE